MESHSVVIRTLHQCAVFANVAKTLTINLYCINDTHVLHTSADESEE